MKTAIIFGHSSGLGYELSKIMLSHGIKVVGVARHASDIKSSNLTQLAADLSSEEDVEDIATRLRREFANFDVLAYCSGTLTSHAIDGLDYGEMLRMFRVNTFAPMVIESRLFDLIKSNGADVVNVTSDSVVKSYPDYHEYAASKIALQKFTSDMQQALNDSSARVIDFCSSGFQSNMRPNMTGIKAVRDESIYPTADIVAELIFRLLQLPKKIEISRILNNRKNL